MPHIRDDLEGVIFVHDKNGTPLPPLRAGDAVPDGYTVHESHLASGSSQGGSDEAPKGNASRDEWAAYAESLGLTVDDDAKRDDIRALVDKHQND